MKRFFLFAIMATAIPALAFGQSNVAVNSRGTLQPKPVHQSKMLSPVQQQSAEQTLSKKAVEVAPQLTKSKTKLVSNYFASETQLNCMLYGNKTIAYDPYTNNLFAVQALYLAPSPGYGHLYITRSTNGGLSWDTALTMNYAGNAGDYFRFPSITVANPKKSNNFADLYIFVTAEYSVVNTGSNQLTFKGLVSLLKQGNNDFVVRTKSSTSVSNTIWTKTDAEYAYTKNGDNYSLAMLATGNPRYTTTSDNNRGDLYQLAKWLVLDANNSNSNNDITNVNVQQWAKTNFYSDPADPGAGYNSPMLTFSDTLGNAYALVNNYTNSEAPPTASTEIDKRNEADPGISTSTDLGATWTSFDWLTDRGLIQMMQDYYDPNGKKMEVYDVIQGYYWRYDHSHGAVAFSPDNISYVNEFIVRYLKIKSDTVATDSLFEFDIIGELNRKGNPGVWSFAPVSSVSSNFESDFTALTNCTRPPDNTDGYTFYYAPIFIDRNTYKNDAGVTATIDTVTQSTLYGHELQLAKTPQGDLVAKWVDFVNEFYVTPASKTNKFPYSSMAPDYNCQVSLDSIQRTDVFISVKRAGTNVWTKPARVFNGDSSAFSGEMFTSGLYPKKGTQIPAIVPSIEQIPLMDAVYYNTADTVTVDDVDVPEFRYADKYPGEWMELACDYPAYHLLVTRTIAIDKPNDVNEPAKADVLNSSVYPNPAKDKVWFHYSGKDGNVDIKIFNMMGQQVQQVYNGSLNTNVEMPVSVSDLASGVYYFVVASNGEQQTIKFAVTK